MKWKSRSWMGSIDGESRIRKRFLIFPMQINGKYRWLEIAFWEEKFSVPITGKCYWVKMWWIN